MSEITSQLSFQPPKIEDAHAILTFRHEFAKKYDLLHGSNELNGFTDAGIIGWFYYIAMPQGTNLFGYEKVPDSTYLAWLGNKIVGIVHIRHVLNDALKQTGGHVGYSTHPDFEGQGVASAMLAFGIDHLRALGVDRVLVTCDDDNIGSQRVIEKNGGVLENILPKTDKKPHALRRYWIG